jgi:hypothetical protein
MFVCLLARASLKWNRVRRGVDALLKVTTFEMRTAVASDAWWSTCVASCPIEWPLTESEVSEYLRALQGADSIGETRVRTLSTRHQHRVADQVLRVRGHRASVQASWALYGLQ